MDGRGLGDYLRQKAAAMREAVGRKPRGDDWRERIEAVSVADDATGVRKLRIRDWQMVSDSGPGFGGWGLGPSSPELLCGVLSTCLTHTYLIGAAWMEVPVERVEVRVSAENNDAPFVELETGDPRVPFDLVARVTLEATGATEAQREALHRYARERCPLTALLRQANDVRIEVAG